MNKEFPREDDRYLQKIIHRTLPCPNYNQDFTLSQINSDQHHIRLCWPQYLLQIQQQIPLRTSR